MWVGPLGTVTLSVTPWANHSRFLTRQGALIEAEHGVCCPVVAVALRGVDGNK